ncbi:endospore germination permease [Brevibacillus humidisoli]|uniref:GerAB/ArcD/ProY family transporter n=1 Tax=Brevibacillus humidisoli TaxID=2895522 RepID=UPI001E644BA0|nr:endospore germination permease [Brevibacillus humidisoli]UFJ39834.1 endospore germination permease [Brevibacillus humidisoli]
MQENDKLSVRQFRYIVVIFSVGTAILVVPAGVADVAKQDAWIPAVWATVLSLLVVFLYNALASQFGNLTLVKMIEQALGKWLGKAVSLSLVFLFFYSAAELLFYVGNFVVTQWMPETPIEAIHILFGSIVILGVRLGLETLARAVEILFPWFVVLFIILVVFVSPQVDTQNLQPVFETGIGPLLYATMLVSSIFSWPMFTMLMMFPVSVNDPQTAKKAFVSGVLVGGAILIVMIGLTILVLGADITSRQTYPSYALAKKIDVGNIVQRIEAVMAIIWLITIYIKAAFYFYASIVGLAQTLEIQRYRFLTLPLGLLMIVFSTFTHPNIVDSHEFDRDTWPLYVFTYGVLLPLLLWAIGAFRGRSQLRKGLPDRK